MTRRSRFLFIVLGLALSSATILAGAEPFSKAKLTPTFWQRDPDAGFPDEGRMHCAPTAISDGLICLSRTYDWKGLVTGSDHDSQIGLITDLAKKFHTDPAIGGTNPDRILTGLQVYVKGKGFALDRLEVMTWRGLCKDNKKFQLGTRPGLTWMRKAANSRDTVVAFNFGWYHDGKDGHTRKGGHWVTVVGADDDTPKFQIHNPLLEPKDQALKSTITLARLDKEFTVIKENNEETDMSGYYRADGPGLPHGKNVTPVLDAVIVFSLKK